MPKAECCRGIAVSCIKGDPCKCDELYLSITSKVIEIKTKLLDGREADLYENQWFENLAIGHYTAPWCLH